MTGSALDTATMKKLDRIRGPLPRRSPTVRVLAAYAQHADCRLASVAFAAGVDFSQLLAKTRYQAPFDPSPFAFQRGQAFEAKLRKDDHALTRQLLQKPLGVPPADARIVNLRNDRTTFEQRAERTRRLLGEVLARSEHAPHLIDGAVLPSFIAGHSAFFEADGLAARGVDGQVLVAEVKSFPKIDEQIEGEHLAAALDQATVYLVLTRQLIAELGRDPLRLVSDRVLLLTPRNVGLQPTLSEVPAGRRIGRIEKVLAQLPHARDIARDTPEEVSFAIAADVQAEESRRIDSMHAIADRVGTAYQPNCLATCGNSRFCRARAAGTGSPCLIGAANQRLIPSIGTLQRVAELSRGATPTPEEAPAAALLARAGRLIEQTEPRSKV